MWFRGLPPRTHPAHLEDIRTRWVVWIHDKNQFGFIVHRCRNGWQIVAHFLEWYFTNLSPHRHGRQLINDKRTLGINDIVFRMQVRIIISNSSFALPKRIWSCSTLRKVAVFASNRKHHRRDSHEVWPKLPEWQRLLWRRPSGFHWRPTLRSQKSPTSSVSLTGLPGT